MKVCLLYGDDDRERMAESTYFDADNIVRDLGLQKLFQAAGRGLIRTNGRVERVEKEDPYLVAIIRKIVLIPLASEAEIGYRHAVMRDCFRHEDLIRGLYRISSETVAAWDGLGRRTREMSQQRTPVAKMMTEIQVLSLLCDALTQVRDLLAREDAETGHPEKDGLVSDGFVCFCRRFAAAFPPERERAVRKVLEDIAFFTGDAEKEEKGERIIQRVWTVKPKIVLECGLEDGLKFSSMKLAEVASENMRFFRPGTTMKKLQEIRYSGMPDSFPVEKDPRLSEQAGMLEFGVVSFLMDQVMTVMMGEFQSFFDQLKLQTAFYLGAINLKAYMESFDTAFCFPEVTDRSVLEFRELREFVMGLELRRRVVGNTCSMNGKDLLIVTGANQGGKSTFLRSIGIAQVMMQCGLPVTAEAYRSGIFPRTFVHFTRREDSSMNSGRLDEELGRMNRIVEQIGDGSLVLLNESFATTTEKEGSVIAYDITKALTEAHVKILMVTHLLSFAKRVYEEAKDDPDTRVEFLSAERKADGTRTFKMIQHAPEMTSFGLDLYEEIVEKKGR
ncbi:MAG: hypothetical protein IJK28_10610 [Clostridia bacterium]|nr:hypothetical protein [Clostridia bacterium]